MLTYLKKVELQTNPSKQGLKYAGESGLDLQYAMGLTNPQIITLLQTGDDVIGFVFIHHPTSK